MKKLIATITTILVVVPACMAWWLFPEKTTADQQAIDALSMRLGRGYVRLAFAVAAHLEPEILIVDEVLAVGDAAFQKKCLGKMQECVFRYPGSSRVTGKSGGCGTKCCFKILRRAARTAAAMASKNFSGVSVAVLVEASS